MTISRRLARRFAFTLTVCLLSTATAFAQSSDVTRVLRPAPPSNTPAKAGSSYQTPGAGAVAIVRTDGAMVYAQPDFDADVLTTLNEGQKVRVSKGTTGSVVKFHKVRAGPVVGFIAEIDVQVEGAVKKREPKRGTKNKNESERAKKAREAKKEKEQQALPIYFAKFVGIFVGQIGYKESISDVAANETLVTYGLKVTGQDVVISGPVVDFTLLLHYGAPTYYEKLSATKPSGFLLLTDALMLLPIIQAQNVMLYFGVGPLLALSKFQVYNAGKLMDLTAFNLGIGTSVGVAYRLGKVALRFEGKYFVEKQQYQGLQLSLQSGF